MNTQAGISVQYNNGILLNDLKNEFSSQEKM
jgi:hypothetical protein